MPFQKRDELLLKRNIAVMLFLIGDVCLHLRQIGVTHAERAIADLPREHLLVGEIFMNPPRRIRL